MLAVLIRSAPYSTLEAAEGLRHLGGLEVMGFDGGVGLFVDDGVYTLLSDQLVPADRVSLEQAAVNLLSNGVRLCAHRGSLDERQLRASDLIEGIELTDTVAEALLRASAVLIF